MSRPFNLMFAASMLFLCGAIQVRNFVGTLQTVAHIPHRLSTDGDQLELRHMERQFGRQRPQPPVTWILSAPYVQSSDGQYLARRHEPGGTVIEMRRQRGADAQWAIEIVEEISPQHPQRGSRDELRMLVGASGARIRLSVFGGPQRGHYLALAQPAAAAPQKARFTLVTDVRQALILEYTEFEFMIDHR